MLNRLGFAIDHTLDHTLPSLSKPVNYIAKAKLFLVSKATNWAGGCLISDIIIQINGQ